MPELLLEIGVEELPVSFVDSGLSSLVTAAEELLRHHRLEATNLEVMGTPRRLALVATLPESQPRRVEEVTGPPWSAAFKDDEPTRAAIGFAKKHGVEPSELKKVATDKGDYVAVSIDELGRPCADVVGELLPELCARVRFPKEMRWGEGVHAFGRPVQWLVSLLDDAVVPFSFAGVEAGRTSRGHRFLAPATFELPAASAYVDTLGDAAVVVRTSARQDAMDAALRDAASKLGGELVPDAFLRNECATLVEKPFIVPGRFDEAFLALPEAVVVSVMRDHQRYFAVRKAGGGLLPHYLNVANTAERPAIIAEGNDRVLRARLADARFFVEEDQKQPLRARLEKLENVVFHRKLGSVGQKVRRIAGLAAGAADVAGVSAEVATDAATLAKADLETLIVFEFPELQGQMGAYYARAEGIDPVVCDAIEQHYKPVGADDTPPSSALGALVGVCERIDALVGCFGVGLVPKGNRDPFALRRAALSLLRIAESGPIDVDVAALFALAYDGFGDEAKMAPKGEVLGALDDFMRARLLAHYRESFRTDIVQAAMGAWAGGSLRDLHARITAVEALRGTDAFEALATAFKRAFNITKDAKFAEAVQEDLLEDGAERKLWDAFCSARGQLDARAGDHEASLRIVAEQLRTPIDAFFDEVFVMADDERVRTNRLTMLGAIADAVSRTVHFHRIAGDA